MASNNLPGIGDNTQTTDFAKEEAERLKKEYAQHEKLALELKAQADAITGISSPEEKEVVVDLIAKQRDLKKRLEGLHEIEKLPHLQRGRGADSFFFGLIDILLKRAKPNQDGSGDRLGKMLTEYDLRVLAEEQERRRLAAEEAARVERAAAAERAKKEAEAEAARQAAERARKPETAAAKEEVAAQVDQAASAAVVEHVMAEAKAEETFVQTLAKPADIMRGRTSGGTLSTMAQENFADIISRDEMLKDAPKLWPHLPLAALQQALNGLARQHGYSNDASVQIAGAKFGKRPKSQVR